jgi:cysteinyl-tRNA synthetase
MDDDLNISAALAALFDFIREINNYLDKNRVSRQEAKQIFDIVMRFNEALGVIDEVKKQESLSKEAEELIRRREEARHSKDWKEADRLREQLKTMGVIIEDTAQGVKWHIEKH